ncbi:MAG: heat-shock protein Hsp20 [Desulfuromonas sp.]|nr:MAG: heat-shock protein Hsp20 [Desulfuromonas sp.]
MNEKQTQDIATTEAAVEKPIPVFWSIPAVDIYEAEEELVLIADLPGVAEEEMQIEVSHGILELEALTDSSLSEQRRGYRRRFKLSEKFDAEAANAVLKDGILTLKLPKVAEAKPKRIAVRTLH